MYRVARFRGIILRTNMGLPMRFIDNNGINDPGINLALEEYCLREIQSDESFLLFYINEPSIIIGRHQNTIEEINTSYVEEHGIHVVRRISGGGAVYHDLGNLNFSFITNKGASPELDFRSFTEPVVKALAGMGVNAELSGRNDITVDGRKISGNAQYFANRRMFSHGTLLFNSEIDNVVASLKVKPGKIESKGLKSIRSRVANICEFLKDPMTIEEFRLSILTSVFEGAGTIPQVELTERDWERIHELSARKYRTWEWNYGRSPEFNIRRSNRFPFGEIDLRIEVDRGLITQFAMYGDFFSLREMDAFENAFIGVPYEASAIRNTLVNVDVQTYLPGMTVDELLAFIL
jgi:lipoate-protein ligase A